MRDFAQIDNAPEERERGITIATATLSTRVKAVTTRTLTARTRGLCEEHDHGCGTDGRRDLVCGATDGPMPQTREHILLSRQVGVPKIVVFLNKVDQLAED